jgi:hypothetical protein
VNIVQQLKDTVYHYVQQALSSQWSSTRPACHSMWQQEIDWVMSEEFAQLFTEGVAVWGS